MSNTDEEQRKGERIDLYLLTMNYRTDHQICKEFGCGKKLTLEESRYGDRCAGTFG